MKTPEVRDIYSIEDLFEPSEKLRLAQVGFAALRKAGLIKKPTLKFSDNEGYLCTPVADAEKTVTLPLALIGYAIETPDNTEWGPFLTRAIEKLKKTGMLLNKAGGEEINRPHQTPTRRGLLMTGESLTFITRQSTPTLDQDFVAMTNQINTVIAQAHVSVAAQKPTVTAEPTAAPVITKPTIYSKLNTVPECRDGALEKIVEKWVKFYSELYGKTILIDDITYKGDLSALATELFMKPAMPIVRLEQAHNDREYLGHLLSQATAFGVEVILDREVPYDSIRYPTQQFSDFPATYNPTIRTGTNVYYDDARRKELIKAGTMKDEAPCISFIRGHEVSPPGFSQYACIQDLASLDDIIAAFVFSGWARKNDPALGQAYINIMPLDRRMHTQNSTHLGRAITVKRTRQTTMRISDFSPTERLRHSVTSI